MSDNLQMVDLHGQYLRLKSEINKAISNVLDHTRFINGPETNLFANKLEKYLDVKHVIPCANGTDALQLALMALNLSAGDEVITPTFTFIATVEVIALLGLKPVLIDVDPHTFNINENQIEEAITDKTKVILPVHLFGQAANIDKITELAKKYNLFVIEDAAQCLGATMLMGDKKKLGTIGHIGCTSFFPSKNLGAFGDGGACFTDSSELANRMKSLANHGAFVKYHHHQIGINSRLDTLQAAVLSVKLNYLDDFNSRRKQAAKIYDNELSDIRQIEVPKRAMYSDHIFHQYTIKIVDGSRDDLIKQLDKHNIPSMVYYPVPIHQQVAFAYLNINNDNFQISNQLAKQVISLPMHTELTKEQIHRICHHIKEFYGTK